MNKNLLLPFSRELADFTGTSWRGEPLNLLVVGRAKNEKKVAGFANATKLAPAARKADLRTLSDAASAPHLGQNRIHRTDSHPKIALLRLLMTIEGETLVEKFWSLTALFLLVVWRLNAPQLGSNLDLGLVHPLSWALPWNMHSTLTNCLQMRASCRLSR